MFAGSFDFGDLPTAADQANAKLAEFYAATCGRVPKLDGLPFASALDKVRRKCRCRQGLMHHLNGLQYLSAKGERHQQIG